MFNQLGIDTTGAGEVGSFVLPAGDHPARISATEWSTDKNNNTYFNVSFATRAGVHREGICLVSADPASKRVPYGKKTLNTLGKAVGYQEGRWTDEMARGLIGKQVIITLSVQKDQADGRGGFYPPRNRLEAIAPAAAPQEAAHTVAQPAPMAMASPAIAMQPAPQAQAFVPQPMAAPQPMAYAPPPSNGAPGFMAGGFGNAV